VPRRGIAVTPYDAIAESPCELRSRMFSSASGEGVKTMVAPHLAARTDGCEDCLRLGTPWVHLPLCLTCGHVGCCDRCGMRGRIFTRPTVPSSSLYFWTIL
jgi:hypothetical protein